MRPPKMEMYFQLSWFYLCSYAIEIWNDTEKAFYEYLLPQRPGIDVLRVISQQNHHNIFITRFTPHNNQNSYKLAPLISNFFITCFCHFWCDSVDNLCNFLNCAIHIVPNMWTMLFNWRGGRTFLPNWLSCPKGLLVFIVLLISLEPSVDKIYI